LRERVGVRGIIEFFTASLAKGAGEGEFSHDKPPSLPPAEPKRIISRNRLQETSRRPAHHPLFESLSEQTP
jgi:hypothetical protein